MAEPFSFIVLGVPAPQGSKTAYVRGGKPVIVDGSSTSGRAKHAAWRGAVAHCAAARLLDAPAPFRGPCMIALDFWLPPISSDPYRTLHSTKPDVDKLTRSVLDALTEGGLLGDDALVWSIHSTKRYAPAGHWTGVEVSITDSTRSEADRRNRLKEQARVARSK